MIKNEKLKLAAKKGEDIAERFNPITNIPFPFEEIVDTYDDLKLGFADLSSTEISGDEDLSGLIWYNRDESKFVIVIEKDKPKNRQYFTIAHELGHYFLHKEVLKEKSFVADGDVMLYRLDNGLSNLQESQANHFAASLLMPERRVREAWKYFDEDIKKCAELFSVSLTAMSIRLDMLGLRGCYEYER